MLASIIYKFWETLVRRLILQTQDSSTEVPSARCNAYRDPKFSACTFDAVGVYPSDHHFRLRYTLLIV